MNRSDELFIESKKYVPGGVHSPVRSFKGLHTTPRFISRASGAYIWDEEGKDYIDFCMSFGPLILGHRHPQVESAIKNALGRGWTYGACEAYSLKLAKFIVDKIPFIEQIRFVNSGTEAVMTAVRLTRGITGKEKIIKFNGCYHGHLDSMLIKAGSGLAGTAEASSEGVPAQTAANTLICELGNLKEVRACFEQHPGEIAGIFLEPLPANNGLLPQDQEFLQGLRDLCDEYQALLIFDEVISGFRMSFGGMAERTGISPDLVTYGKIIGGGMPVGAVAGPTQWMEYLAPVGPVYQAGTLSANPLAMEAGLATMEQLNPNTYDELEKNTQAISAIFTEWMQAHGFEDYQIISQGSLFWAAPTKEKIKDLTQIPLNLNERFYALFETLLNKGIYLAPNAYEVGFVSTAHNAPVQEELRRRLWN